MNFVLYLLFKPNAGLGNLMNLKEFSKKTGIPVSTISKALGNYKDVNIDTKNKIVELAKKFNYVPNLYAKTLASGIHFLLDWFFLLLTVMNKK